MSLLRSTSSKCALSCSSKKAVSRTLPSRWYTQPASTSSGTQLPIIDYAKDPNYKIYYMRSMSEANTLIDSLQGKIFALDIEWRVKRFKSIGKTALVQLCDNQGVYLFHIKHMREFPTRLRELLENPYILKPGCNIRGDGTRLFKDYGVESKSLLELGSLGIQVSDEFNGRKIQKLTTLVEVLLQRSMKKDHNIALSNWEAYKLSPDQINYAGNDAYVGYKLFERIRQTQLEKSNQKFCLTLYNISNNTQVYEVERTLEKQMVICNNSQDYPVASITNPNWNAPVIPAKRTLPKQELEAELGAESQYTSLSDLQSAYFKHENVSEITELEPPTLDDFQKQFCQEVMDSWIDAQFAGNEHPSQIDTGRTSSQSKPLPPNLVSARADLERLSRHTQIYQEALSYSESWASNETHSGGDTDGDQLDKDQLNGWSTH